MGREAKLIVALDVETFEEASQLIDRLQDTVGIYKVGSQLFTACGPMIVRYVLAKGKQVFLDLKFHDIPNTVANAVTAAVDLARPVHEAVDERQNPVPVTDHLLLCTLHT
ncbi:MAG: orotidine 5'-phosphate decarboxylase, partial [Candidatus Omnitrophica bacterium]|nr:orotidine 5'-phosphate decarboxylase [Candidatus Omnitrophota bacterium]